MALDESAMTDLVAALRRRGLDVVREALGLVLQALIDTEASQQIGANRDQRSASRTTTATGPGRGCCRPKPAMWSWASPSCGRGRSSRRCWSRAAASTGRCWRSSWRPRCTAPPPLRSTTWSERWVSTAAAPSVRSPASAAGWTPRWPPSGPARCRTPPSRRCSWTPPTSRPGWMAGSSPGRW